MDEFRERASASPTRGARSIEQSGIFGEIDLLSIDIDGNDYWVWKAMTAIRPRVVVIEYNSSFGPDRSVTVAYDPSFRRYEKHPSGLYYGASLQALNKLAAQKGYFLAGCDSAGVNAFFVRDDLADRGIAKIEVSRAFVPQYDRIVEQDLDQQFAAIQALPLDTV